jgi:hypothetical protein
VLRTACFAFTCCALLAAPVSAQEWARKMFEVHSHDFGAVARGAKVEFNFSFSNIYEEDLHVAGVRSSCGCTTPHISKDTLKTYEKGAVVASFNTRAFQGQKNATVTVTFDKPFYAEVQLQVSGYIRTDVVLSPGAVEFGTVDHGAKAEKTLTITYAGRSDWKVLDIKSASNHLEADVKETSRGNGQVSYNLTVRLKPDAPVGYLKEQLLLVTTDAKASEFPVDVEGRVVSELTVSPSSLFMGVLQPGQKVTKQLVVQGKKPFMIKAITSDHESFEFPAPSDKAKTVHLVPVTFVAGDKPGKVTYKIHIETDQTGDGVADLSAHAQIIAKENTKESKVAKDAP